MDGTDGAELPDPGSDGEMPDEPALGRDGEIPSPPELGAGVGVSATSGFGSDGCGKLGVICSCANVTGAVAGPSFIGEFPERQGDGAFRVERDFDG